MLTSPLAPKKYSVVAFDLNPSRVRAGRELGLNVMYGEGWRESVLEAAQINPTCLIITYSQIDDVLQAVACAKQDYPDIKIYVVAQDIFHAAELKAVGATVVLPATTSTGVRLGRSIMRDIGMTEYDVQYLSRTIDQAFGKRVVEMAHDLQEKEKPVQQAKDLVVLVAKDGNSNPDMQQLQRRQGQGLSENGIIESSDAQQQQRQQGHNLREDDVMMSYSESLEGTLDDDFDDESIPYGPA
eukprot:TRINITY_DN43408_c0_g1_i1.p1 TRINITY_DN43408_c0_g1~~TRINITY_DN43408_c0_g1_i1.p1  ORF type:complete len:262 (-),score=20.41 TRINITY_DN43408_c0_g1_i1:177-899(-)